MEADIFITQSYINRLKNSSGASLLDCIFYISQRLIGDCLGDNDEFVKFIDNERKDQLILTLIEIGEKEEDILVKNRILQLLLFLDCPERSLPLAKLWMSSTFYSVQEGLALLKTMLIVLERSGSFPSKDKNKWLPDDIISEAGAYLESVNKSRSK